jgi:signal peptidase II
MRGSSVARAWGLAAVTAAVAIGLDQLTKAIVNADIARGERVHVFLGIDLVNVRNEGVAFGFLAGAGQAVVLALTGVALAAMLVYFARHTDRPLVWLPTGLLIGGAVGNVIDRARLGAVVDFIDPGWWPAFNVADACITVGVVLLVFVLLAPDADSSKQEPPAPGSSKEDSPVSDAKQPKPERAPST